MKPLNAGILTIIIVTLGMWSRGEKLTGKHAVAAGFAVIMLMVLGSAKKDLAQAFGMLFVVAATLTYGMDIAKVVTR